VSATSTLHRSSETDATEDTAALPRTTTVCITLKYTSRDTLPTTMRPTDRQTEVETRRTLHRRTCPASTADAVALSDSRGRDTAAARVVCTMTSSSSSGGRRSRRAGLQLPPRRIGQLI
jgi:hypothetical protein